MTTVSSQRLADFVSSWQKALRGASYVPVPPAEREAILTQLARRLAESLMSDSFDPQPARQVGAQLVANDFATPEALGRTVAVVQSRLSAVVGADPMTDRLVDLLEALTVGFATAMNDRSLDGQEAVRLAALNAQARAEEALRESEARFRRFATRDALTELPNRTRLTERIVQLTAAAATGGRMGLLCIDLDSFGTVNDSLGHWVGDQVLATAADRLRSLEAATDGDYEVFRLDSDEFVVLLGEVAHDEQMRKIADRVMDLLSEPFHVADNEVPIGASVGMAEAETAHVEPAELLRSAEIALHWAKADGKGRYRRFEPERAARDTARYRLSAAMPGGLKRGEFTVAYQPLVNMIDGRLAGVEALARWRHPELGLLPAGKFVGLAEDTGLVVALDDYILKRACRQAAQWQSMASDVPYVSVNLAARQLRRTGLAGYVAQVLDETGLRADRLQLEITEHAVIGTDDGAVEALNGLANLGVRIAIDDFGTGYSNLAVLSALPVHGIKLDAAFARDPSITSDTGDRNFIATVVKLGHTLGLEVIAEGIESVKQARRLRDCGCDVGQGWLFGRPTVAPDIEDLIEAGRSSLLGPAARPHYR